MAQSGTTPRTPCPLPVISLQCRSCGGDLSALPPSARFCPGCGDDIGPFATPEVPDTLPSVVVTGYAAALYNMGRRYERGVGGARNADEALRCYVKAARLGNLVALSRLAVEEAQTPGTADLP